MATLKALIFDVDGTLAETERDAHRVAFNDTFAKYHLDWHWSETLYGELLAVTGGKERIQHYWENYRQDTPAPNNKIELISQLHRDKTARYNEIISQGEIALRPGVKRLIQEAREHGLSLAISTTTSMQNVTSLLQHSGSADMLEWFKVIAAGDIVAAKKPAPDIYLVALEQLQLPPEACIAIEDSRNGLQSAWGANIHTVITVSDYTRHENFNEASLVVDQLGEVDQPFTVLAGDAFGEQYVSVNLLQKLAANW